MNLIDVNLLVYAEDNSSKRNPAAREWFESVMSSRMPIVIPWVTIIAFLRLTTNPKSSPNPLSSGQALIRVQEWLKRDHVRIAEPGLRHWEILSDLIFQFKLVGNSLTDAHLAAMAIENSWTLYSADKGFARYPKLKWVNPLPEYID
jgi:toxin-antitoxin system PIN domain toxin